MTELKFKIFATDGKVIREIFFITHGNKGDFYFGYIHPEVDAKFSRHVSGEMHSTVHGIMGVRQKLSNFKGFEQLSNMTISKDILEKPKHGKHYEGGKFDGSAFIDVRNYNENICINTFLLEPNQVEVLVNPNLIEDLLKNAQVIIFTQTSPWIMITANNG
ncbi:MAG: hypothetical protein ABSB80_11105 [Methanoregula sp.]|jgi:hypothetical protein|uniref:hypothetical protein n=1 Tax=Methanoregula sp. TaxID=2052170 RepID=UPI003D0F426F